MAGAAPEGPGASFQTCTTAVSAVPVSPDSCEDKSGNAWKARHPGPGPGLSVLLTGSNLHPSCRSPPPNSPQSSVRTPHKPHPGRLLVVCGPGLLSRWAWVPAGPEARLQQGPAFTQLLALTISHQGRSPAKRVPVLRLPGQAQAQSRQALWAEGPRLALWF